MEKSIRVAIIMDGNGRWAESRGLSRSDGHLAGAKNIQPVLLKLYQNGVRDVTLYALSCDNLDRPREEVLSLFQLIVDFTREALQRTSGPPIIYRWIGFESRLPPHVCSALEKLNTHVIAKRNDPMIVRLAINYSARKEILRAAEFAQNDPQHFKLALLTDYEDIDLIIRTGGEKRLSDFLLWQSAYAELFFMDKHWPEISPQDIQNALEEYAIRKRRFGNLQKEKEK